jgi:hypothetical protein
LEAELSGNRRGVEGPEKTVASRLHAARREWGALWTMNDNNNAFALTRRRTDEANVDGGGMLTRDPAAARQVDDGDDWVLRSPRSARSSLHDRWTD